VTDPVTEAEWDTYVRIHGRQFPHCLYLAEQYPAPKKKTPKKGKK